MCIRDRHSSWRSVSHKKSSRSRSFLPVSGDRRVPRPTIWLYRLRTLVGRSTTTVSYTHLDVYKRQLYALLRHFPIRWNFCLQRTITVFICKPTPVSYTHLDVYKRQSSARAICSLHAVWFTPVSTARRTATSSVSLWPVGYVIYVISCDSPSLSLIHI